MSPEHPRVFVISGPSGVGKSSIIQAVLQQVPEARLSVSMTTRDARPGERDGVDYQFVNEATFMRLVRQGEFLEWAKVYDRYYGTNREHVQEMLRAGHHVIMDVDSQGARQIRGNCGGGVFILIAPPSLQELERRLRGRATESDSALALRLEGARNEIAQGHLYDHFVVNDELERSIQEVVSIIRYEAGRPSTFTFRGQPLADQDAGAGAHGDAGQEVAALIQGRLTGELAVLIGERFDKVLREQLEPIVREAYERHRQDT